MNNQNLMRPKRDQTAEERRKQATKAGKASGEARRQKKQLTEWVKILVNLPANAQQKAGLEKMGVDTSEEITINALLGYKLIQEATKGNLKAVGMIRDYINDNKELELKCKKLEQEIEVLKAQAQSIQDNKVTEDLGVLADMLKEGENTPQEEDNA